jgi:hypothetical protein
MLGGFALIIGTLLAGIGVVRLALFATASGDDGGTFGQTMAALVLTLTARSLAKLVANRLSGMKTARVNDYEV